MKSICLILSLIAVINWAPPARAADTTFGCDMAGTCHFVVFSTGGARREFVLMQGGRGTLTGVDFSNDIYCVCLNRPAPRFYGQCASQRTMGCAAKGYV